MKDFITSIGKFILLKKLFPYQYNKYCKEPVKHGKVIFIEVRSASLSNSMKEMYRKLESYPQLELKTHFLLEGVGGRKENVKRTLAMLKDMATAEYVFLSDANNSFACFEKRPETTVVQLWHGCGAFKKFGLSTAELKFGSSKTQQQKYPLYNNLDLVTVSSPQVVWAYEEAMGLEAGIVKPAGISRTDVFFDDEYIEAAKERVYKEVPQARGKKIVFYAPTFRGDVANAKAPDELDMCILHEMLGDEYVLIIKHHPFVKVLPEIPESCRDFAFDVSGRLDIEALICAGDVCISDYSSLVFEYALFERPMIFFAYDIDEYNDWRGFYYDYNELTPGPVVRTTQEIAEYIRGTDDGFDTTQIKAFREEFMSSCDGHATDRILEMIGLKPENE